MYPWLHLGPITISTYSVLFLCAFIVGGIMTYYEAKRQRRATEVSRFSSLIAIWSIAYTLIQRHRYTHRLRSICHCLLTILFGGIGCNFERHLDHQRLTSLGNRKGFQHKTRCTFNSS